MSKKQSISNDITLIVTTYNRSDYLELVLKSILRQSLLPLEVIVADDGSTHETRNVISRYSKLFPIELIHSWIPDKGFRLSKSRNKAISISKGSYIIIIDGDIVLTKSFVADHNLLREKGYFVNGCRARLSEMATNKRLTTKNIEFTITSAGLKRPLTLLRLPWLHKIKKGEMGVKKIRGCNMSFWKDDCIAINGFEEMIEGWGCEDTEFVIRLYNYGIRRKNAYGLAPCIHLYHKHGDISKSRTQNRVYEQSSMNEKRIVARVGINQYLRNTKNSNL